MPATQRQSTWSETAAGSVNGALTVTKAAVANQRHVVTGFVVQSVHTGALGNAGALTVTIKSAASVIFTDYIPPAFPFNGRLEIMFPIPIVAGENEAITLNVPSVTVGQVNGTLLGYTT